jgi:F-type H+-transporting ATPase subunit delta
MSRIAKRYGRALFNLTKGDMAKAKSQLAALNVVKDLFAAPDAGKVLSSPVMPADLKKSLLDYALDKASADQDVRHLIDAVIYGGRVAFLPKVAESYAELIDEAEGVVRANVTAAVALSAAETEEIGKTLGGLLNKKVNVKTAVDPALLGGIVANVGNYRIDMSLKTKLEGLSQSAVQDRL